MTEFTCTITLTDRPPVKIREDQWPVIAEAGWSRHDGKIAAEANRSASATITIRQHEDGRAIVYGVYRYHSRWLDESDLDARGGAVLNADAQSSEIVAAIHDTIGHLTAYVSMPAFQPDWPFQPDWRMLADECIADLPAEEL